MAKDEDFRRVAEDVRALARSLANDFRSTVDQSRRQGHATGQAFKHGIREVAEEAKRGVHTGLNNHPGYQHWRRTHGADSWWGVPPGAPPPPPPGEAGATPGSPAGGPPYGPPYHRPGWQRNPRRSHDGHPRHDHQVQNTHHHRPRTTLPPVRRRWDATTVIGMLAVLFGVAWLVNAIGAVHVSVEAVVAIGLMTLGASLVVTGRTDWSLSRHSWPVWLGIGMIAVLIATSATFGISDTLSHVSFGNMTSNPTSSQTVYGGFGKLTVNASSIQEGATLKVESVAGSTTIELPKGAKPQINAKVFAGQICYDGRNVSSGVSNEWSISGSGTDPVTVDAHQAFGQMNIYESGNKSGTGCNHK